MVVLLKLDKLCNQQSLLKTIVEELKSTGSTRINWRKSSYGENLQQYGIIHSNLYQEYISSESVQLPWIAFLHIDITRSGENYIIIDIWGSFTEPPNLNRPIFLQSLWQFGAQPPNLIPANISCYTVFMIFFMLESSCEVTHSKFKNLLFPAIRYAI